MATSTCSRLALAVGRQDERQRGLDDCGAADPRVRTHAGRASLLPGARSQPRRPPQRRARRAVARRPRQRRPPGRRRADATPPSEPLRGAPPTPHASSTWPRARLPVDGPSRARQLRLLALSLTRASLVPVTASRCPRAPQPDAILELALGEHHLDRIAFVLETGHNNVLQRVDAPRRPRDLAGQPPQAELGRRDVEHEIEQPSRRRRRRRRCAESSRRARTRGSCARGRPDRAPARRREHRRRS